jgi:histidinol-phosphate aminotransferase
MTSLGREALRDLRLYAPEEPCAIDLSDNTNLWGAPPAAEAAIRDVASGSMRRYPETYAESLKDAIAQYVGLPSSYVVTGVGSDDVLDSTLRAFADSGDSIAVPSPTFVMMPVFARLNRLRPIAIPLTGAYDVDAEAMIAAAARITYLCSPNNPTGAALSRAAIDEVARRTNGVVMIDEAYFEFSGESAIDLVQSNDRVLIVRTFSKAFGLAGLRIGYAIGAPALVAEVEKARGPYKVSAVAAAAACAALSSGVSWMKEHVALANGARDAFSAQLLGRGLSPAPSKANFVFLPIADATAVAGAMRRAGVAVRAFTGIPTFSPALQESNGAALRITVGPSDVMAATLRALDEALA